jgi:hypothetical protein
MVETVLVRSDLAPRMIEAGRELVTALDSHGSEFEAAFWLMDDENGRWHLFLSSRSVKFDGSMAMYAEVREVISTLQSPNDFRVGTISIVGHRTPVVKALRETFGTTGNVDGARLDDAFVGNVYIPACIVYRLSRRQKLQPMTSQVRK